MTYRIVAIIVAILITLGEAMVFVSTTTGG
jgi:hypothetical protein